ncbi:DNA alkylation repair protein [Tumebacillus lipolyticus]|uniref:DNA alkylation repair protein n=1 Tax=Tumebacillus lipolyticus TaxID=1280370 RepID=A0ABW4ZTN6_9BACL
MELAEVLAKLEAMGTEQNRKVYGRHGIGVNMFGVSFAEMKKLAKEIKKDQRLTEQLWETGNWEARVVATMIADPKLIEEAQLHTWVECLTDHTLTDVLTSNLASKTPFAQALMVAWIRSEEEWVGRAGWQMLTQLALGKEPLPDEFFEPFLEKIGTGIHQSKNRIKEAMNTALIAIGSRNDLLEAKALQLAAAIGKVKVDHGETACKTPDATAYINKMKQRKLAKAKA